MLCTKSGHFLQNEDFAISNPLIGWHIVWLAIHHLPLPSIKIYQRNIEYIKSRLQNTKSSVSDGLIRFLKRLKNPKKRFKKLKNKKLKKLFCFRWTHQISDPKAVIRLSDLLLLLQMINVNSSWTKTVILKILNFFYRKNFSIFIAISPIFPISHPTIWIVNFISKKNIVCETNLFCWLFGWKSKRRKRVSGIK